MIKHTFVIDARVIIGFDGHLNGTIDNRENEEAGKEKGRFVNFVPLVFTYLLLIDRGYYLISVGEKVSIILRRLVTFFS